MILKSPISNYHARRQNARGIPWAFLFVVRFWRTSVSTVVHGFFMFVTKSGNGLQPIERTIITNIKRDYEKTDFIHYYRDDCPCIPF